MKSRQNTFLGILITIIIYFIYTSTGKYIIKDFSMNFNMLYVLSTELFLTILAIYFLKPNFSLKIPKLKPALKVFFTGFGITVLTMMILNGVEILLMGKSAAEAHPALKSMNVYQVIFFVFIGASIIEELLFRGFLLNMIKPLKQFQVRLFNRQIGLHIIISGLLFGAAHLILLKSGSSIDFVYKIVIATTILGVFAGYMQEKYNNTSYAILAHMGFNLIGVLGMILMQFMPH